jgi:ABC-type transport system involved in cytochrome c biogenesis permease subunit
MDALQVELISFWSALVGYAFATALSLWALVFRKKPDKSLLTLMSVAWVLHTVAIGARWERLGYLPFINMFEMLSANIWGFTGALLVGCVLLPRIRVLAAFLLPVIMMVTGWMLMIPRGDSSLPPTYHTIWLFVHIGFIKLFMGCAFVALGIAVIVLLRSADIGRGRLSGLPDDDSLDGTGYRCMALALIFDTLALLAGSIWAYDAWGRYWGWDSLEVWSLLTWLSIALTLHVRRPFRTGPVTNAWLVIGTFVVAFFTFFGIPFVSTALHRGMV